MKHKTTHIYFMSKYRAPLWEITLTDTTKLRNEKWGKVEGGKEMGKGGEGKEGGREEKGGSDGEGRGGGRPF